jgi:tetratricopeptide (TPR) repeat protein
MAASGIYFIDSLYPDEGSRWIETALPLARQAPNRDSVIALSYLVIYAAFLNDRGAAEPAQVQLRQWMSNVDDPLAMGTAFFALGIFCQINSVYAEAVELHRKSLSWFQQAGYPAWIVISMLELGNCLVLSGAMDAAWAILEEGIAFAGAVGSSSEMAYGLLYLGFAELSRGDLQAAAAGFAGGLDQALGHHLVRVSLGCICGIAGVARVGENAEAAARLLGAVEAARQSSGIRVLPNEPLIDEIAHHVRNDLGVERDLAFRQEGALLTYERAVELARGIALRLAGNHKSALPKAVGAWKTASDGSGS